MEIDKAGNALTPMGVADENSLADVIGHVHQIGWQLRLGEHIEATRQAEKERGLPPASEKDFEDMRQGLAGLDDAEFVLRLINEMREGSEGEPLDDRAYRLRLEQEPLPPTSGDRVMRLKTTRLLTATC